MFATKQKSRTPLLVVILIAFMIVSAFAKGGASQETDKSQKAVLEKPQEDSKEVLRGLRQRFNAGTESEKDILLLGKYGDASDLPALRESFERCKEPQKLDFAKVRDGRFDTCWIGTRRALLITAMARLGDQASLDRLIVASESTDANENAWAAHSFGYIGSRRYMPLLKDMITNDTPVEDYMDWEGIKSAGRTDNALDVAAARAILRMGGEKPTWSFLTAEDIDFDGAPGVRALNGYRVPLAKGWENYVYNCRTLSKEQRKEILAWVDATCAKNAGKYDPKSADLQAQAMRARAQARINEREKK